MSIGKSLLAALIEARSKNAFRQVEAEWFIDDEVDIYNFIRIHFRTHGTFPDNEVLQENGFVLTRPRQPFSYYLERIKNRAIFNAINEDFPDLAEAMKTRNMEEAIEIISSMNRSGRTIANTNDFSVILEEAALIEEDYKKAKASPGVQGITFGYEPLDEVTDGAHGGELLIIAGRPNVGKSYKLLKMAMAAWDAGNVPLILSMEMGSKNLALRAIAMKSGLNPNFIRKGQLSSLVGEQKFYEVLDSLKDKPPIHFVRGNFKKNTGDVDNAIQELSPDIVYIDAAYELRPEGNARGKATWERIAEVFTDIKTIAENRNVPIVASVQINREGEQKSGKKRRPKLGHLGGADAIAQVADMVVMMYPGLAPREKITRDCFLVKNREGDNNLRYQSHFTFNPMKFDYIEGTAGDVDQIPNTNDTEMFEVRSTGYTP